MIGYTTLGTNDLDKASKFYDELLSVLGAQRIFDENGFIAWGTSPTGCGLAITKPNDGEPATVGNGVMPAIAAESTEQVDAIYNKAIELGAKDEGAPGDRGGNFYAGYFRDLDGNKLNAYIFTA